MVYSLRARVVFPVDGPPIEHGVVTIDGERIVAVGERADAAGTVHDLGDVALLPGLINAHTHLEFSELRRPLGQPETRLADWIRLVIAERARGDAAPMRAIGSGLRESIAAGVTTVGEIATAVPAAYEGDADVLPFVEVIGFSRARAESALAAVEQRLDAFQAQTALRVGRVARIGVSPHAPYTVSPELLMQLVAMAKRRQLPMAMHLAESPEELELLRNGGGPFQALLDERSMWDAEAIPRGSRPLDYLTMLAGAPRAIVIHGNYLDADERAFLASHADRMSLVYCPRTHAYFNHAPYPLSKLLAASVRVAIGTDSRASNPDLDLFGEMRQVAIAHPTIDPYEILRLGTLAGAEALGLADNVGNLTVGKLANVVAVSLRDADRHGPEEILAGLLTGPSAIAAVWVRGRLSPHSNADRAGT